MKISAAIENELKEISPLLAGMERINVFSIPQGYFDGLSTSILSIAKEAANGAIDISSNVSKQQSFDVPDGYFDNLADNILLKIKTAEITSALDELRELSPLLYSIQHENVFKVPAGYFEGVANNITGRIQSPATKVVVMRRRNILLKYAAAAVITGIMAIGVYKFIDRSGSSTVNTLPVATLDPSVEKGKVMNESQFNETLNSLSAEDIASYLEKNTDETDVAILASNIEKNSLPSQEDYLLDDKALENYLKDIDLENLNN